MHGGPSAVLFMVLGAASSPAQESRVVGSWQPSSSVVSSDEKPGEHEWQPEAEPGMGGQRRPEGFAHLGEWMDSAEAEMAGPGRVGLTLESWGGLRALRRLGPAQDQGCRPWGKADECPALPLLPAVDVQDHCFSGRTQQAVAGSAGEETGSERTVTWPGFAARASSKRTCRLEPSLPLNQTISWEDPLQTGGMLSVLTAGRRAGSRTLRENAQDPHQGRGEQGPMRGTCTWALISIQPVSCVASDVPRGLLSELPAL